MITVGLVKELFFIAHVFNRSLSSTLHLEDPASQLLMIKITPAGDMDVFYGSNHIWYEKVEGDTSFFGIESCDTISRIIACIDNGTSWDQYIWKDCLDKPPSLT